MPSTPVQSEADVVNLALASIGHTEFIDTLDQSVDAAIVATRVYAQCRDDVLRAALWPFAKARIAPAVILKTTLSLGKVPGGWGFAFAYPADCLRVRKFYAGIRAARVDEEQAYVIEYDAALQARVILADIDTPEIEYTTRIANVALFPPDFVDALQWRLAVPLAAALVKNPAIVKMANDMFLFAVSRANAQAQTESRGDVAPKPSWIANR